MAVTVIVRSGAIPKEGRREEAELSITLDGPLIVLGRGEGCDVRLPDPSVSHRHASIRQRGNEYILVDERSTNGTVLGGVKLGAQAPRLLKHGDLARLGRVWIEVRFDRPTSSIRSAVSPPIATRDLALQLVARALEAHGEPGGPRLVVIQGDDAGKALSLEEAGRVYVIGRGQDVDLILADTDASRRHVQLVRRADQLLVRDLGSKNGADLAGARLSTERDCVWRAGQTLRLGKTTLEYQHPAVVGLAELEKGADERLRDDEEIAPPNHAPVPMSASASASAASSRPRADVSRDDGSSQLDEADAPMSTEAPISEGAVAPIAEVPERPASTTSRNSGAPIRSAPRGTWSSTDLLVVLLAFGVLALSVLGLLWLFRT